MNRFRVASALLFALLLGAPARADDDAQARAARAFDEGVAHYERAAYADAARAFLRADDALPSPDALKNALASARQAGEHLLIVEIARRAAAREGADPALAVRARQALAQAETHLAKVELRCEPAPCSLQVDAEPAQPGTQYLLPGTHSLAARGENASRAEERLTLAAGATYTVLLHPTRPGEAARPSEVAKTEVERGVPRDRPKDKPLSPAVFYAGVGVGVVLLGATTWSGFDALGAKNDLPERPTTSEVDDVHAKVRRTDILLGATVVVAAATTWAGLTLVDFGGASGARLRLSPTARSMIFDARFR